MNSSNAIDCLRALAQTHRLAAFRALVQAGEPGLCVSALQARLGIPGATLSAHLNTLRRAGLVLDERQGRTIQVRADFRRMAGLLDFLTENCCQGEACIGSRADASMPAASRTA
jgi:DNA-binding transcriptional ArsR family regulator